MKKLEIKVSEENKPNKQQAKNIITKLEKDLNETISMKSNNKKRKPSIIKK